MAYTKQQLVDLLLSLNISPDTDSWDAEALVRNANLPDRVSVRCGSSKCCIVPKNSDYVVKWVSSASEDYDDDCDEAVAEAHIYAEAVKRGPGCFFPYTEVLGTFNGVTFVLQEKVDCSADDLTIALYKRYQKIGATVPDSIFTKLAQGIVKGQANYCRDLNEVWGKAAISLYGKRACIALCAFVRKYKINDLHSGNVGYKNGRPVILDFSGYHR